MFHRDPLEQIDHKRQKVLPLVLFTATTKMALRILALRRQHLYRKTQVLPLLQANLVRTLHLP